MTEVDTTSDDTIELTSGGARLSVHGSSPPGSMRSAWKVRLGWVLWGAVVALALFEIVNRVWLGWYHPSQWDHRLRAGRFGWWTDWHRDPASIAAMALVFFGVWWEAGRISRPWLRRTIRIAWIATPILALTALLWLMMAAMGLGMR
jgi:hypothetical protein